MEEVKKLNFKALKDLLKLMTDSQVVPSRFRKLHRFNGEIDLASSGNIQRNGRKCCSHRFSPQDSWPDNTNLDARRLLWPIKKNMEIN